MPTARTARALIESLSVSSRDSKLWRCTGGAGSSSSSPPPRDGAAPGHAHRCGSFAGARQHTRLTLAAHSAQADRIPFARSNLPSKSRLPVKLAAVPVISGQVEGHSDVVYVAT